MAGVGMQTQQRAIYNIMRTDPRRGWTVQDILDAKPGTILTSVHQVFHGLTVRGYIVKLSLEESNRWGKHGRRVHAWRIAPRGRP